MSKVAKKKEPLDSDLKLSDKVRNYVKSNTTKKLMKAFFIALILVLLFNVIVGG